jgi:hypothetical protein
MKKLVFIVLPLILLTGGALYWYFNFAPDKDVAEVVRTLTALEKTGDECTFISEKAAIQLPEALPFQKLEKAARKARVLNTCMQDRGYKENPLWVKNAKPIAQKNAESQLISYDEAYEMLRRQAMYLFKETPAENSYWIIANRQ